MELKNLNNLKDEIEYLEEAEWLVKIFKSCFFSYYEFKDFVIKNASVTERERDCLRGRLDMHFNFDDSE